MMVLIPGAAVQSACRGVIRPDICGSEYNHIPPATCEHPDFHRRACSSLEGNHIFPHASNVHTHFLWIENQTKCIQMSRYMTSGGEAERPVTLPAKVMH